MSLIILHLMQSIPSFPHFFRAEKSLDNFFLKHNILSRKITPNFYIFVSKIYQQELKNFKKVSSPSLRRA